MHTDTRRPPKSRNLPLTQQIGDVVLLITEEIALTHAAIIPGARLRGKLQERVSINTYLQTSKRGISRFMRHSWGVGSFFFFIDERRRIIIIIF